MRSCGVKIQVPPTDEVIRRPNICLKSHPKDWRSPESTPGPEVIKLFSCSSQLSVKFQMLINTDIAKINGNFRFKSPKQIIHPANKC